MYGSEFTYVIMHISFELWTNQNKPKPKNLHNYYNKGNKIFKLNIQWGRKPNRKNNPTPPNISKTPNLNPANSSSPSSSLSLWALRLSFIQHKKTTPSNPTSIQPPMVPWIPKYTPVKSTTPESQLNTGNIESKWSKPWDSMPWVFTSCGIITKFKKESTISKRKTEILPNSYT